MVDAIFDANSLFARAYFAAVSSPELKECVTSKGVPCGATVAALKTVLCLLNPASRSCLPDRVDRLLFCWDSDEAKNDKGRDAKPEDYHDQKEYLRRTLYRLLGCAHATALGEADDAVATAAYRSEKEGNRVYVVSGDKDLHQTLGGKIRVYSLNHKALVQRRDMLNKWGIKRPIQLAIYLAVAGDPGDRIAGVRGYGPKTTHKLFERVSAAMTFSQAFEAVRGQLPQRHRQAFEEALEITLLRDDVRGVPDPAPVQMADADYVMNRKGLETISGEYFAVYSHYTGTNWEELLEAD